MGGGGDASKSPPENAQKFHKTVTLISPKSRLKNTIKVGFFWTVILSKLMANWWTGFYMISAFVVKVVIWGKRALTRIRGVLCSNQILPSNLHPYCNKNHTFLLVADSIIFLHSYVIFVFNFFCKILQHPKINPGSAPAPRILTTIEWRLSSPEH